MIKFHMRLLLIHANTHERKRDNKKHNEKENLV